MSNHPIDRRGFVQHSVAAVGLGVTGNFGALRDAIIRSHQQGKPVLSEASMNSYVSSVRTRGPVAERAFAAAVRTDVRAFLRGTFTLTADQERGVSALTPTDISTITSAVERGVVSGNAFVFRMRAAPDPSSTRGANCGVAAQRAANRLQNGANAETWTLQITVPR